MAKKGNEVGKEKNQTYSDMIESTFISDLLDKLRALKQKIDQDEYSDADIAALDKLIAELPVLNEEWRAFTDTYLKVTKDVKKLKEDAQAAGVFQKHLKTVAQNMREMHFRNHLLQQEFFAMATAQMNNLEGRVKEMKQGAMDIDLYVKWFNSEDLKEQAEIVQPDPDYWFPATAEAMGKYVENLEKNPATLQFEYVDRYDDPLFPEEPSPDDIAQGALGDSFFVSSLSAICAANPGIIRKLMKDNGKTVTVPIWEANSLGGILGKPRMVTVKKTVPAAVYHMEVGDKAKIDYIFGEKALWVQMMEKAYVASGLHEKAYERNSERNFGDIDSGGTTLNALSSILGLEYKLSVISEQKIPHDKRIDQKNMPKPDDFFEFVKKSIHDNDILVASAGDKENTKPLMKKYKKELKEALEENNKLEQPEDEALIKKRIASRIFHGIALDFDKNGDLKGISEHAYAITNTYEISGKKYIIVRNTAKKEAGSDCEDNTIFGQIGYSAIPVEEFKSHFFMTVTAKPVNPTARRNIAAPFVKFTEALYETVRNSLSIEEKHFEHMSPQFAKFYEALQYANNMCKTEATSHYSLNKAFDELSKAAQEYIMDKTTNKDTKDKRNLRTAVAKAAFIMTDGYLNKGDIQKIKALQKDAGKFMLVERMKYCVKQSGNDKGKSLDISKSSTFKTVLDNLDASELVYLAGNKADKIPKLVQEASKKIKEAEAKQKEQQEAKEAQIKNPLPM